MAALPTLDRSRIPPATQAIPTQIDLNPFHIKGTWTHPQHRDTALDAFTSAVERSLRSKRFCAVREQRTLFPIFCSLPIFLASKTPKTPFFALCFTETLATQARENGTFSTLHLLKPVRDNLTTRERDVLKQLR